jgi:hypothetical protein
MPAPTARGLALADLMILVAAAAVGAWGAAVYRAGIPIPIIARPGLPLLPLLRSVPLAAALTWALLVIPVRTLRARTRRLTRQPGSAACVGAAAATLGVVTRWSLRAWITPYADGSLFVYGARILYEWAAWCGLGVAAALALLALKGCLRTQIGWVEGLRLGLGAYWLVAFLIAGTY